MPWNANNNPAGEIRAPAMSAALRLQQQRRQQHEGERWSRALRVVAFSGVRADREELAALRYCALMHPAELPPATDAGSGVAFMFPRSHAQFVVSVRGHSGVESGCIALTLPQAINLELCIGQVETWSLFQERVPAINVVAIEIRPLPPSVAEDSDSEEEVEEEEEKAEDAAAHKQQVIEADAPKFAAAFTKYTWQRVLTENERLVMPFKGEDRVERDFFVRVLEIDAEDESETEFTMPDSFRGVVDEDTQVLVSVDGAQDGEDGATTVTGSSLRFRLLNAPKRSAASLASMRSDVVNVITNDEEEFPVKKKLLFPCIKLSSAVLSGKGVHKDASTTVNVDVDCLTFDRVLLYLEHELRNDGSPFQFDPSVAEELLTAAKTVGCIGLQEVCEQRLGEFHTRVRKDPIRWEEVVRRNEAGEVWLVMQGMVLDVTRWIPEHPGGSVLIAQEALNVDCTVMFEIYHSSRQSFRYLKQFYIGELAEHDRNTVPNSSEAPSAAFVEELQQVRWSVSIARYCMCLAGTNISSALCCVPTLVLSTRRGASSPRSTRSRASRCRGRGIDAEAAIQDSMRPTVDKTHTKRVR